MKQHILQNEMLMEGFYVIKDLFKEQYVTISEKKVD